jgi:hypothetical protein
VRLLPLLASMVSKFEYRLTESGLDKRPLKRKSPRDFKDVFRWQQLSYVVPAKYGFKYYRPIDDSNPFRRFWKAHISDAYSGEFHVEVKDRDDVLSTLARLGIRTSAP